MDKPTGFLGKNFSDMTKDEVLQAFDYVWSDNERNKKELRLYQLNINNVKIDPSKCK